MEAPPPFTSSVIQVGLALRSSRLRWLDMAASPIVPAAAPETSEGIHTAADIYHPDPDLFP